MYKTIARFSVILLVFIFLSGILFVVASYASDSPFPKGSQMMEDEGKDSNERSIRSDVQGGRPATHDRDMKTDFSGYPESFVIPRGVCEVNEPVMVIGK